MIWWSVTGGNWLFFNIFLIYLRFDCGVDEDVVCILRYELQTWRQCGHHLSDKAAAQKHISQLSSNKENKDRTPLSAWFQETPIRPICGAEEVTENIWSASALWYGLFIFLAAHEADTVRARLVFICQTPAQTHSSDKSEPGHKYLCNLILWLRRKTVLENRV